MCNNTPREAETKSDDSQLATLASFAAVTPLTLEAKSDAYMLDKTPRLFLFLLFFSRQLSGSCGFSLYSVTVAAPHLYFPGMKASRRAEHTLSDVCMSFFWYVLSFNPAVFNMFRFSAEESDGIPVLGRMYKCK